MEVDYCNARTLLYGRILGPYDKFKETPTLKEVMKLRKIFINQIALNVCELELDYRKLFKKPPNKLEDIFKPTDHYLLYYNMGVGGWSVRRLHRPPRRTARPRLAITHRGQAQQNRSIDVLLCRDLIPFERKRGSVAAPPKTLAPPALVHLLSRASAKHSHPRRRPSPLPKSQ